LCSKEHEVSAHYFISSYGVIYQLVKDEDVAWHAGVSAWGDMKSLNFNSIGIEIFNSTAGNSLPYKGLQYKALYRLMAFLLYVYKIPIKNVLGHSDIAPDRKTDPGYLFHWQGLYSRGFAEPLPFIANPTDKELFDMGYKGQSENNRKAYFLRFGQKA
jgi:N-acetyl-anhydromuramyl-L-alanine amidase AmpD